MKKIYDPKAGVKESLVPIEEGGSYASNIVDAVKNLGAVTRGMVGRPGGVAVSNENNELPSNYIPASLAKVTAISLMGPTTIDNGSANNLFTITNYDSTIPYVITAVLGTFTRDADNILFTSNGTAGVASLTINGNTFSFYSIEEAVVTPQILFPVDGSSPGYQTSLLVSAASFNSNRAASSHLSSDWEISTNSTFTSVVASSYSNTVDLINWAATGLLSGITYYARTRQRADTMRVSGWSTPISFTMTVNEHDYTVPGTYTFVMANNGTVSMMGQGAGGGGGGGWDSIYHSSGLGGGGGSSGESKTLALSLLKNDVIKIVIPEGGTKGTAGGYGGTLGVDYVNGGDGSPALIYVNNVLKLTALGGLGGKTKTSGTGDAEWAYGGAAVGNGTAGASTRAQVGGAGGNSPTGGIGGAANTVRHTAGNPGTKGAGGGGAGPVTSWSSTLPGGGVGGAGYAKLTVAYDQVVGATSENEYLLPGTFTYTVGAGVDTAFAFVQAPGGGGGSGYTKGGGGGGAGEYKTIMFPVVEGDVITIVNAAGGVGGTTFLNGETLTFTSAQAGGNTIVKKNGVVVATSLGGAAGVTEGGSTYRYDLGGGGTSGANSEYAPGSGGSAGGGQNFTMAGDGTKGGGGGGGSQYASGDNFIGSMAGLKGGNGGAGAVKLVVGNKATTTYSGYFNISITLQQTFDYVVQAPGYLYVEGCGGNVTVGNGVKKELVVSTGDVIRGVVGASGFAGTWSDSDGSWIAPPANPSNTTIYLNGVSLGTSAQSPKTQTPVAAGTMTIKYVPKAA